MNFPDKFHLTKEQSTFLAKKKWDENVYCGMKMENRAVTFPQTRTILNGVNVPSVQLDDIQAILNMRDVWKFLLATVDEPVTMEYLCKLNEYIARNEALSRDSGLDALLVARQSCKERTLCVVAERTAQRVTYVIRECGDARHLLGVSL